MDFEPQYENWMERQAARQQLEEVRRDIEDECTKQIIRQWDRSQYYEDEF